MSVLTPGYILEISEDTLLINGHPMPFGGKIEEAIEAVFDQLSQLTMSGAAPGGLGVVIKDARSGGMGEVSRTIPSGSPVTLAAFEAASSAAHAVPAIAPAPEPELPAVAVEHSPEPTVERTTPPPVQPEPTVERTPAPAAGMSVFARLAQEASVRPVAAQEPPQAPVAVQERADLAPRPVEAVSQAPETPAEPVSVQASGPVPVTTPYVPVHERPAAPSAPAAAASLDAPSLAESRTDVSDESLSPAPEEPEFDTIFKEDEPIVDEGIRTPIGQSLTARQRTEGFSMKSQARREVERRTARKRKLIYSTVAAVTLVAALRIVGAVMAGPSGDYAAVCVDARTMQRQTNNTCAANSNPFAQTVYFGVGQAVPAVGSKAQGGAVEKPKDPRNINTDVNEGRGGVVLDGGEVK